MKEPGLRERKKAQQKVAIMEAMVAAMEQHSLKEVRVEDLCRDLSISKVTFFNYFNSKEEVFLYYICKWEYNMLWDIEKFSLKGKEAVLYIFNSIALSRSGKNIIEALIQYFLKSEKEPEMKLTPYEFSLFNKEASEALAVHMDLYSLLNRILNSYLEEESIRNEVVSHLITGLYGIPVKMKRGKSDAGLKGEYRRFIGYIFSSPVFKGKY